MSELPTTSLWEVSSETVCAVRALHSLEGPRAREAVSVLREWAHKQPHFRKKDFSDHYLENIILASKGSVERAKEKLDKCCTVRTMMPMFFEKVDAGKDFKGLNSHYYMGICPRLTEKLTKVVIYKIIDQPLTFEILLNSYKYCVIIAEYLREYDCSDGLELVVDYTEANLGNLLPKLNPIDINQWATVLTEAYSLRLKNIYIISDSKLIDSIVNLLKQFLSKKLGERIHVFKTYHKLKDHVSEEILPSSYGGKEKSIEELSENLQKELSSPKTIEFLKSMRAATSDESRRATGNFNEQYAGLPGSFRSLVVD